MYNKNSEKEDTGIMEYAYKSPLRSLKSLILEDVLLDLLLTFVSSTNVSFRFIRDESSDKKIFRQ